jgi:hypothetical protein
MLATGNKLVYYSFGLHIHSEYPLPELPLPAACAADAAPELTVRQDSLDQIWQEASPTSDYLAIHGSMVLIRVPDTAIFGMRGGTEMIVSPYGHADSDKIRLYILGTCMGVILMQRQILPLHGSAIAIAGKAYAIVGLSGAGKSTLASLLLGQGHQLISDDLIAVTLDHEGKPHVMPAYPQQKMWQDAINLLGMNVGELRPLYERETKFAVPVPSQFCSTPLPLAGVYELIKTESDAAIKPINGLEKFHTLLQHTFRGFLLEPLGLMEWHFSTLARFAGSLPMQRLHRPQAAGFSAPKLSAYILNQILKGD